MAVILAVLIGRTARAETLAVDEARQVILVLSENWTASTASLQRIERDASGAWQAAGSPYPVSLGKAGLAWGRGLQPAVSGGDPVKHEGDLRAPAGIFELGTAFGYGPAPAGLKLPYLQSTAARECVDDPKSVYYNRLIDRPPAGDADWKSAEKMLRKDVLYKQGIVIHQNSSPAEPGAGSCVFLHIWRSPKSPTVGCTAMAEAEIAALLGWLDPAKHPLLIQMPRPAYERYRTTWHLPDIAQDRRTGASMGDP